MPRRIQVALSDDEITALDEAAAKLRQARSDYKLGVANVVAEIIGRVLKEGQAEYLLDLEPKEEDERGLVAAERAGKYQSKQSQPRGGNSPPSDDAERPEPQRKTERRINRSQNR